MVSATTAVLVAAAVTRPGIILAARAQIANMAIGRAAVAVER